jgi:phosphoribosylanthranilate isomerase
LNPVRVKVCGLTDVHQALACARAGADWIGLNFHPASPRFITTQRGAEIASALLGKAEVVGLFVDRPIEELVRTVESFEGMETIQLHGDEDVDYLHRLSRSHPLLKVVRAFRLSGSASIDRMVAYLDRALAIGCPPTRSWSMPTSWAVLAGPGNRSRSTSSTPSPPILA